MEKKINLLYDGRILYHGLSKDTARTGIYFVARNVFQELKKRNNVELYLYFDRKDEVLEKKLFENLSMTFDESKILYASSDLSYLDVFLAPAFRIPDCVRKFPNISLYTILYDTIPLLFPRYFSGTAGWFIQLIETLSSEEYYFSISDYTTQDFLRYFPQLDKDKIDTIPLSSNFDYKPNTDKKTFLKVCEKYHIPINKKYLFSLCSLEPRKNLIRAVKTFVKFIEKNNVNDLVYVLGGGAWAGFMEKFKEEVPEYKKYEDKIIRAGYIDDEDLETLYSNAEWFVYTSQYEGFGMPPLEAMKCGCPVITSNNSSLPEVVGDAGIMIDWDSDEQHIAAYEKYYFDEKYRQQMAKKGLERSKNFSWKNVIDIILKRMFQVETLKHQKCKISIIRYNKGDHEREIELIEQSYKDIEIINIEENCSQKQLLDVSVQKTKGQYILFMPQYANFIDEQTLSLFVTKAMENKADICYGNVIIYGKNNQIEYVWSGSEIFFHIYGDIAYCESFLISKNLIVSYLNDDTKINNIFSIIHRALSDQKKFIYINKNFIATYDDYTDADKEEIIESFADEYGKNNNLSYFDIMRLYKREFYKLSSSEIIELACKIKDTNWLKEYIRVLQQHTLTTTENNVDDYSKKYEYIKIFKIPLFKIKSEKNKKKFYLFNYIPLWKTVRYVKENKHWLFGKILMQNSSYVNYQGIPNLGIGQYQFKNVTIPATGLGDKEDFGRWSIGKETRLHLGTKQRCIVSFQVNPFTSSKNPLLVVDAFVNGNKATTWRFEFNKPIPKTDLCLPKNDSIEIKFVYHNPISPQQVGISEDQRELALAFLSFSILPRSKKINKKKQSKIYQKINNDYLKQIRLFSFPIYRKIKKELPKEISYEFNKENPELTLTGFSGIEQWGRWSDGKECSISFFNYNNKSIQFDAQAFLCEKHPELKVKVYVNGKKQDEWIFKLGSIIVLKTIFLKPFRQNTITFKIKNPTSPQKLNISADERVLGIGIKKVLSTPNNLADFMWQYKAYINKPKLYRKKQRLFITTGNFSLLNSLCYIEETKNEKTENYLLIFGATNKQFIANNLKIAEYGNFKKIIVCDPNNNIEEKIIENNLYNIDEIIFCCHVDCFTAISKLYYKAKLIVIMESMMFFNIKQIFPQKISSIFMQNYLNKMTYPYDTNIPIKYMDKSIYNKVLHKIQTSENLTINVEKNENYVLFIGPAAIIANAISKDDIIKLIQNIQNKGYKVLFKKHPRDITDYSKLNVEMLDTAYPLEFYDLSNILGVVGYNSTCLCSLADEITTFYIIPKEVKEFKDTTIQRCSYITEKYCLPIDVLLNAKQQSFEKMQKYFRKKQKDLLQETSNLSEDKEFLQNFPQ